MPGGSSASAWTSSSITSASTSGGLVKGLSPLDELDEVVRAVSIPVQAVGGLSLRQAIDCPSHGAPLVVLGAPLVIDADEFKPADNDLEATLREICRAIRETPFARPAHWGHILSS